jgi:hypothetical protein
VDHGDGNELRCIGSPRRKRRRRPQGLGVEGTKSGSTRASGRPTSPTTKRTIGANREDPRLGKGGNERQVMTREEPTRTFGIARARVTVSSIVGNAFSISASGSHGCPSGFRGPARKRRDDSLRSYPSKQNPHRTHQSGRVRTERDLDVLKDWVRWKPGRPSGEG